MPHRMRAQMYSCLCTKVSYCVSVLAYWNSNSQVATSVTIPVFNTGIYSALSKNV